MDYYDDIIKLNELIKKGDISKTMEKLIDLIGKGLLIQIEKKDDPCNNQRRISENSNKAYIESNNNIKNHSSNYKDEKLLINKFKGHEGNSNIIRLNNENKKITPLQNDRCNIRTHEIKDSGNKNFENIINIPESKRKVIKIDKFSETETFNYFKNINESSDEEDRVQIKPKKESDNFTSIHHKNSNTKHFNQKYKVIDDNPKLVNKIEKDSKKFKIYVSSEVTNKEKNIYENTIVDKDKNINTCIYPKNTSNKQISNNVCEKTVIIESIKVSNHLLNNNNTVLEEINNKKASIRKNPINELDKSKIRDNSLTKRKLKI